MSVKEEELHYTKIDASIDQPQPIFETVPITEGQHGEVMIENNNTIPQEVGPDVPSDEMHNDTSSQHPVVPPALVSDDSEDEGGGGHIKMYIILGLIFFIVIASLVFLFNTLKKKIVPSNVRLVYWGLWEEESTYAPLISKYEQEHKNITIEYKKQVPVDYREKIIARSKDGSGPDLFRFHNTWVPMLHDVLSPIPKGIMSNDEFKKTFYTVADEDLRVGNAYYGIPLYIDDLVLLYNDDFYKKVGITGPPRTWDDVITYAKQLTVPDESGNPITAGIALGTANNIEHFTDILGWMLLQNGVNLKDVSTTEGEQVLKRYREFAEPPTPVWSETMTNSVAAFTSEKVAMIFAPSWEIANIRSVNGELNMKVAQLPILPGETEPFSIANYWVEGVSKTSKHQKEAWEFMKYLSSKESETTMFDLQKKARGTGLSYSRVDLKESLLQNEESASIIAQAPYLKSIPTISRTYDNGLNDEINKYLEDAVNNAISGVSYGEAMDRANDGIQSVLEKYKIK